MRHVWVVVAAAAMLAACDDSPVDPGTQPEPVYDLLYESFVGSQVLLQPIEGGQPVNAVVGVAGGLEPSASADGTRFVFVTMGAQNDGDIAIAERASGQVTRLTTDAAFDEQPALSADGQRIAFVSDRDGPADIFVMNRNGTGRVRLTTDPLPGTWVDRSPAWSPDGSQIAFASNRTGTMQIWIMQADGSGARRLTNRAAYEEDPSWSPDGQRIAYFEVSSENIPALVISDRNGNNRFVVPTPPNGVSRMPAWSPDGKLIAFTFGPTSSGRSVVYTVKPDGSELTLRTQDGQDRGARNPAWLLRR